MMRSIWKGYIRFSLVTIPIRIYNAIDTEETTTFHQLHAKGGCNGRIGYEKRCKKCEQIAASEDIVKGYEYEPGLYVRMESADFEKIKLKSTKTIDIEGFVDLSDVPPTLYEAPYYAGPDGEVAQRGFALLCEALSQSGKLGIGKVVLREREDVVMIAPHENGLILYKLRYPQEVRDILQVPGFEKRVQADPEQLKLARSLVDAMAKPIADIELKDRYHEALKEIIDAKIAGREVVAVEEAERPVVDIMTALKLSIEQAAKQRKPMVKAAGKAKEAVPVGTSSKQKKEKGGRE